MRKKPLILIIFIFLMALPTITFGQLAHTFDFSDDFYRANGIDPDKLVDRIADGSFGGVSDISLDDDNRADVRNLSITGGFDAAGDPIYYSVFGKVNPDTFTPDKAGLDAMTIGNQYRVFIFPKKDGGKPLAPPASNRRQDNIFDTRVDYFNKDPLGTWRLVFVSYTEAALKTLFGFFELHVIAERNGRDLDGTPVIKRVSVIEDLAAKGLIQLRMRAPNGDDGFPWVI